MDALNGYSFSYTGQGSSAIPTESAPKAEPLPAETDIQPVEKQPVQASSQKADEFADTDQEKQPSDKQIEDAVKSINKHANGTEAIFGIHEKTNRVTIKIVDKKTHEVIKEVPPEKTLDLIAKAWEMAGLIVDDKR